jgi:prepilin-type N-terminal cleavage/methylation domain-containing protein
MIRNQKGVTLIELLAALTILSLIGGIIWGVFFQGNKFSQTSVSKNNIQQEANIIIMNLKKIHQTSKEYTISSNGCAVTVNATKLDSTTQYFEFKNTKLCISLDRTGYIQPGSQDLTLNVTIYELMNPKNTVIVETILYRLKDGVIY